ncbi:MAG: carboxymuconolactone decarboxylase family protein [Alphaproteobacteria bacterium]|nr:carboxymuconolactone decarboxylase family protein [Alphaproteobacteria bacterium]
MAQKTVYDMIPQFGKLRDEVLFGDVWEQPELSKRDRSLVTCSVLAALYRTPELKGHLQRALDNGVTREELFGMITHIAFYSGWPTAVNAGRVLQEVLGDDA